MPHNLGLRIARLNVLDELFERRPLLGGEIVFGLGEILLADTSHHADADAVLVPGRFMRPDKVFGAALFDFAVAADHPMVTDVRPTIFEVPLPDFLCPDVHVWARGRAVDDDEGGRSASRYRHSRPYGLSCL